MSVCVCVRAYSLALFVWATSTNEVDWPLSDTNIWKYRTSNILICSHTHTTHKKVNYSWNENCSSFSFWSWWCLGGRSARHIKYFRPISHYPRKHYNGSRYFRNIRESSIRFYKVTRNRIILREFRSVSIHKLAKWWALSARSATRTHFCRFIAQRWPNEQHE